MRVSSRQRGLLALYAMGGRRTLHEIRARSPEVGEDDMIKNLARELVNRISGSDSEPYALRGATYELTILGRHVVACEILPELLRF